MLESATRPAQWSDGSDRDCPLGTVIDPPIWHVSGTVGTRTDRRDRCLGHVGARPARTTRARTWRRRLQLDRRVRLIQIDYCLVGKRSERAAAHVPPIEDISWAEGPGEAETSSPRQMVEASPGGSGLVLHLGLEVIVAEQVMDGDRAIRARPGSS